MKLPVIFAGHGSPMIALEDNELTKEFQKIGERVVSEFEKPKAILSFSAHWFTRGTYVQSDPEPRQVYDMYGFPKELYEVQIPSQRLPGTHRRHPRPAAGHLHQRRLGHRRAAERLRHRKSPRAPERKRIPAPWQRQHRP